MSGKHFAAYRSFASVARDDSSRFIEQFLMRHDSCPQEELVEAIAKRFHCDPFSAGTRALISECIDYEINLARLRVVDGVISLSPVLRSANDFLRLQRSPSSVSMPSKSNTIRSSECRKLQLEVVQIADRQRIGTAPIRKELELKRIRSVVSQKLLGYIPGLPGRVRLAHLMKKIYGGNRLSPSDEAILPIIQEVIIQHEEYGEVVNDGIAIWRYEAWLYRSSIVRSKNKLVVVPWSSLRVPTRSLSLAIMGSIPSDPGFATMDSIYVDVSQRFRVRADDLHMRRAVDNLVSISKHLRISDEGVELIF